MTLTTERSQPAGSGRQLLNKVPEVTLWFWVIKVLCTTVGESLADYINTSLGFGLDGTAVLFTVVLAGVLALQFRSPRYVPTIYWLVVVVLSVTGTLYTDILTDEQGVPLAVSTAVFTAVLVAVFGIWYARERTLSIHSIVTRPRESFYWLAILVTFALGTAAGDWTLELTGWTPGRSVLLPLGLIAVIALGWRLGGNAVLSFWLAYVLTRPLGANLGDYLGRSSKDGGLGLGLLATNVLFLAAIAVCVAYLTRSRADVTETHGGVTDAPAPTARGRERLVLAGYALVAVLAGLLVASQHPAAGAPTASESEAPAPAAPAPRPGMVVKGFTPAQLQPFAVIAHDVRSLVAAGRQQQALSRVRDLEKAWDDAQPTLQAANPTEWTVIDRKVDGVLKSVRASSPNPATETAAADALIAATR